MKSIKVNKQKTKKIHKDRKTSFPKDQVENAELHKLVTNNIMIRHNQRMKYNFGAPLIN